MSKKDRALEAKQFPIFNNFHFQRLGQFSILATLNFGNFQFWQFFILAIQQLKPCPLAQIREQISGPEIS